MKLKILLFLAVSAPFLSLHAQKKEKKVTAYAITGVQKGSSSWTEVRLVDVITGEEVKTINQSKQEVPVLNARTGKPIVKKDIASAEAKTVASPEAPREDVFTRRVALSTTESKDAPKVVVDVKELNATKVTTCTQPDGSMVKVIRMERTLAPKVQTDKPFATASAACAYDRKHERLYYTPMGINQLRYIDLKSGEAKVYFFEDEAFGAVKSSRDVANQITRMVIASDGNGYALSNNAEHLVRFTTKKKAEITDRGALTDDPANGANSIRNSNNYGGDMIADTKDNLYLITANRAVYKIDLDSKVATYKGQIQGLPRGFSTNGAMVEEGTKIIVCSSNSTQGYFRFDLNTLQAEKISTASSVFNASDLASGAFVSEKKKKEEKQEVVTTEQPVEQKQETASAEKTKPQEMLSNKISVYPNPVSNGVFRLSLEDQLPGKYNVQLVDVSGKMIFSQDVVVNNKTQIEEFRLPQMVTTGTYFVKVSSANKTLSVNKLLVQ